MQGIIRIATRTGALAVLLAASFSALADRPVLGVAEFQNSSGAAWWRGGVGWELSGMLANELASIGAFTVVERSHLEHVLNEQDLAAAGRIAPGSAAQLGQLTGAQYIVLGTVTSYEENVSDSGGGLSFRGISIGGNKGESYVAVDIRVVDAATGELAHVRTIEGRSSSKGIRLGAHRGGFGGNLAHADKTPAGQAIRAALMEITDYLECAMVTRGGCLAEYEAKESTRRERTRGKLKL